MQVLIVYESIFGNTHRVAALSPLASGRPRRAPRSSACRSPTLPLIGLPVPTCSWWAGRRTRAA